MNENEIAYQQLISGIQNYVKEIVDNAKFDETITAIIKGVNDNGYTISLNGIIYDNVPTLGGSCEINETVKVLIPQNNYNNMFILKSGDDGGGGGTVSSYTMLSNKPQINSNTLVGNLSSDELGLVGLNDISVENTNIDFTNYFE